jgi:ABC-type Fe3+/spermidine/putrescine transport system ATPase subunit
MHRGQILQEGSPVSVYGTPKSRAVADFIGRVNWFDGTLGGMVDGYREFQMAEGRLLVVDRSDLAGQLCQLCVRPERLVILESEINLANGRDLRNSVSGTLATSAHLGAEIHYMVRLTSGRALLVTEQNRGQTMLDIGTKVRLAFRPSDCVLIPRDADESR